jgi:hypothetical protein
MKRLPGLSTVLIAIVASTALTGCAVEDKPAAVKVKASSPAPVLQSESTDSSSVSSDPSESASESTPTPPPSGPTIGDLVTVGDWDVKVTKVVLDAVAQIRAANQFNDRAKGQYVLVTYAATYNGPERSADAFIDLTWTFTTSDQQVNNEASEVTQADNEEWPTEARSGGTVKGQVVFDLPTRLIKGGILTVEGYDENFDTVYADFPM